MKSFEAKCEILRNTGIKPRKKELAKFASDENPELIDALTLARLIERYKKSVTSREMLDQMWTHVLSQQGTCDFVHFKQIVHVPNALEIFSAIDSERRGFITKEDLLKFIAT
jgi:Ca2+-binding EF-hand superfamily protein